jgi:palmitoyltransferase
MAARFILETIIFYSDALLCLCAAALQGFRTYPSFLHFLASVTLLAAYVAAICIRGLVFAFSHPLAIVRVFPLPSG